MKYIKELPFYDLDGKYGFSQGTFGRPFMRLGGCAIVTACDISICLKRHKGIKEAYPFNAKKLLRREYIEYTELLFPYLHPRYHGVNSLKLYMDSLNRYYEKAGISSISIRGVDGELPASAAAEELKASIENGIPAACLTLRHNDPRMSEYVWHWYVINGYRLEDDGSMSVKLATYGESEWMPFEVLWDTGREPKGGLVIYELVQKENR